MYSAVVQCREYWDKYKNSVTLYTEVVLEQYMYHVYNQKVYEDLRKTMKGYYVHIIAYCLHYTVIYSTIYYVQI